MKVECLLEKLKTSVNQIEKIAGKNLSLPILGTILLETGDSVLIVRATNLNIGAEIMIPAKIIEPGKVAIPASLFAQVCNTFQGDIPITLSLVNENIVLQTKTAKMTLKAMSAEDFPTIPHIISPDTFEIPADQFVLGLKSVAFAASQSDIKPEIASVYIYTDNDNLVFVATDAFRLAEKKIFLKKPVSFPEILIPVKNISEMIRILADFSGNLEITIAENQIAFSNEKLYLTSRLTGGNYPNYRQIIPKESKTEIVLLKSDLQTIIKSSQIFSDKFNQIDLVVDPSQKLCTVTSKNNDTGEGVITLEAALSGNPLETRMNHRYITDVLSVISTDSLSFSFTESNRPMIIKGIGDTSFLYLVMPMNR